MGTPQGKKAGVFISHTTQDARDLRLAHDLADALLVHGAKVWVAPESIPAGSNWRVDIVHGIMEECTHFLVILSKAAVESGWVQREIELAKVRCVQEPEFKILPLFVGHVSGFPNEEFLREHQQIPCRQEFAAQLKEVLKAVGLGPAIPYRNLIIIEDKTKDFVGREYVFAELETFLANNPSGYFIIEGDPGAGKSAILAEYARRTGCICHFNVRQQGINTARHFLESVCSQLIERYGLDHKGPLPLEATEDGAFLARLLEEASGQLGDAERLVIAVDALDEVELANHKPGANVLYLPPLLPKGVFFVLTRRPLKEHKLPWRVDARQRVFDLMDEKYAALSRADIKAYIRRRAEAPQLRAWIDAQGISLDEFVELFADKSENNFMYLRHVLPAIEEGIYRSLSIDELPRGLESYYEDHWRRMGMTADPLPAAKINIVYVLCEAGQPISRTLLADFVGQPEPLVQSVIDDWHEFVHEQEIDGDKRYSIYHSSFRDFLHRKDIVQAAGVSIKAIHGQIADNLWRDIVGEEEIGLR